MNKKIIEQLAKKYNLPKPIIEKVVSSQFKHVADTMSLGEYTPIRLPYFGVFAVKPMRLKKLKEKRN